MKESSTINIDIQSDVYTDIKEVFDVREQKVQALFNRIFHIPGKAIRPKFMALVASFAGGSWDSVRRAAVIIEVVHVASLLHDDVIDGSELRRGAETVNSLYSDKVSVLTGDYIVMKAIQMAFDHEDPEVLPVVLKSVNRMVNGEIHDSLNIGIIDEETYLNTVADKTASLFAASGELAMILSGASDEERMMGREVGECIGLAFQIVDDALDYHGEEVVMGKPENMDARTGRMTLPLIHSLRKYDSDEIHKLLQNDGAELEQLLAVVSNNGGIDYALKRAREYVERAREIVLKFSSTDAQQDLDAFLTSLIERRS
ncbi:polyprenyl synthetase family protein [Candidatus Latescibacterota bacterium]